MQLKLDKQTKFHIDNIKKEIERLLTFVENKLQKVTSIEQDFGFLQS